MPVELLAKINTGATYDNTKIELQRGNTEFSLKTGTRLLMHCNLGDGFKDFSKNATMVNQVGNGDIVFIANGLYALGNASLYLSGGSLNLAASTLWNFSGDFSIRVRFRFDTNNRNIILSLSTADWDTCSTGDWSLNVGGDSKAYFYVKNTIFLEGDSALSANIWYTAEIRRVSGLVKLYIDGTAQASTATNSATYGNTKALVIGKAITNLVFAWNGYLDEIEITDVVSAHADYTPPIIESSLLYPSDSPTVDPVFLIDSGNAGTVWDMSAIDMNENSNGEAGSVKYQYSCSATTTPTYNGSWLTLAQLQAESDPTGRYMIIKAELIGDGIQDASIADSLLVATIPSGDIPSTDPGISNVLEGVDYVIDGAAKEGTLKKYSVTTTAADTIRQQIMDVLDARLKTILVANGYKTNLGQNVRQWDDEALPDPAEEPTKFPAIKYRDTDDTTEDIAVGLHLHTLPVEIEIIAVGGTAKTEMRKMIADVIQCIGADLNFSALAEDTKPISPEMFKVQQADKFFIAAKATIEIEYTSERFNAYT